MHWKQIRERVNKADEKKWLRRMVGLVGFCFLGMFLLIAVFRYRYPFEIEWMEGAMLDGVLRITRGWPLYVQPGVDYIPYIYAPLYFYLSALVFQFADASLATMRLISLACTVICFAFIYAFVRRVTQDRLSAWLSVCLFSATFAASGAWFDLARVDMPALAFFFAAIWLLQNRNGFLPGLTAGVFFALAFAAKQSSLMMSVPILVYMLWKDRKTGVGSTFGLVVVMACFLYICNATFGRWFSYYVFQLPSSHAWVWRNVVSFWIKDTLRILPLTSLLIVFYFMRRRASRSVDGFWLAVVSGMMAAAFFSRLHRGGFENVLIPAHAALAILFGMAVHYFQTHPLAVKEENSRLLYLLCIFQFLLLLYDPVEMIPSARDRQAGERYLQTVQRFPGEVYLPLHGYVAQMVGKQSHSHDMAIADVFRGDRSGVADSLRREFLHAFANKRFSAVILDDNLYHLHDELKSGYVPTDETLFYPYVSTRDKGGLPRMERIYVPRPEQSLTIN